MVTCGSGSRPSVQRVPFQCGPLSRECARRGGSSGCSRWTAQLVAKFAPLWCGNSRVLQQPARTAVKQKPLRRVS
jgi:hypothetical protein